MDKRYIQFIVVTALFLIGWSLFVSKFYPSSRNPILPPPRSTKITTDKNKNHALLNSPASKELPIKIKEITKKVTTDKFIITYSLTGGYIKNIYIKPYKENLIFNYIGYTPQFYKKQFTLLIPKENTVVLESKDHLIKKVWKINDYHINLTVTSNNLPLLIDLFRSSLSTNGLNQRYQEVFYKQNAIPIKRVSQRKLKNSGDISPEFVGSRDRYFCVVLFHNKHHITLNQENKKVWAFASVEHPETVWDFYVGPQLQKELVKYKLDNIINYGFFNAIGVFILKILYVLKYLTHSWGVSLILLSIIIYLILFPFTMKSTQAMKKMQEIQPLIQELQKKYKDNPQKLQKEQLGLFKKNKVNPLGGCLPLFFQFPVFIALYQVLFRFIELKGAQFLWIKDLSLPDHTFKLPFSLPYIGSYFNILPLFIIIISYIQQKITTSGANSQQQSTAMIFMLFIGVIFYNFPSCLVIYWFIQNILTVLYQYRVHRVTAESI